MRNIAVFGGTFNPPHKAHLKIADYFLGELDFDSVYIIPTFVPPHKQAEDLASGEDRLEMCRLTFEDERYIISDIELKRQGKSYTYDTLCEILEKEKDCRIYLIVGSDMFFTFHEWYRYKDILGLCTLCVMARECETEENDFTDYAKAVLGLESGDFIISHTGATVLSSSLIRYLIKTGGDAGEYLMPRVKDYIDERGLYRDKHKS